MAFLGTSCEKPDVSADFSLNWNDLNWGSGNGAGYIINGSGFDTSAIKDFELPLP